MIPADNKSGIFGYINYLIEKDRAYIIQTLVNGAWLIPLFCLACVGNPAWLLT